MPPRKITETATDVRLLLLRQQFSADGWVAEYRFHSTRKWAFDYASPVLRIAIEIEGGVYGRGKPCPLCKRKRGGAHSSVTGILRDIEKYNEATVAGWRVLRFTPKQFEVFGNVVAMVNYCRNRSNQKKRG